MAFCINLRITLITNALLIRAIIPSLEKILSIDNPHAADRIICFWFFSMFANMYIRFLKNQNQNQKPEYSVVIQIWIRIRRHGFSWINAGFHTFLLQKWLNLFTWFKSIQSHIQQFFESKCNSDYELMKQFMLSSLTNSLDTYGLWRNYQKEILLIYLEKNLIK